MDQYPLPWATSLLWSGRSRNLGQQVFALHPVHMARARAVYRALRRAGVQPAEARMAVFGLIDAGASPITVRVALPVSRDERVLV